MTTNLKTTYLKAAKQFHDRYLWGQKKGGCLDIAIILTSNMWGKVPALQVSKDKKINFIKSK